METLAPTNFPYLITRACTSLPHAPAFSDLPDGYLRIVLRIIQKINLKCPYSAIFASRATIATEAGKSTDTVHRAVKWLEDKGFIERERKAFFGNRGSISAITPTKGLLQALALVDRDGKPIVVKEDSTKFNGPKKDHPTQGKMAGEPARTHDSGSGFVKVGKVLLPKDLAWLCNLGISAFGVLYLMKAAREAKQRLSEVISAARKYVECLPAREVFAYVRKLIGSGRDFSYLAKKSEELTKIEKNSEFLKEKLKDMEGLHFVSRKNAREFVIEGGVLYEIKTTGQRTVHIFSQGFMDALHEGRLVSKRRYE